jgi:hypothetical protein
MAVNGMDTFIEHFKDHREAFVLIGGSACDLWFAEQNLSFRATKDLDVVLVLEKLNAEFIDRFREFITNGGYEVKTRNDSGPPVLYRFAKPDQLGFPYMIELFCRELPGLELVPEQHIIPVRIDGTQSLSAILLHDTYYQFLLGHCGESRGIMSANGMVLLPLKARAWRDLTARKEAGEEVKEQDIKKHRNDVFLLAATLPGDPGAPLPDEIADDVTDFLRRHPLDHPDWDAIKKAIKPMIGGGIKPATLISAIQTYYQLNEAATGSA